VDLQLWHGPFQSGVGYPYFVNAEGCSSWEDPRVDAQMVFELQAGILMKVAEISPTQAVVLDTTESTSAGGGGSLPRFGTSDTPRLEVDDEGPPPPGWCFGVGSSSALDKDAALKKAQQEAREAREALERMEAELARAKKESKQRIDVPEPEPSTAAAPPMLEDRGGFNLEQQLDMLVEEVSC